MDNAPKILVVDDERLIRSNLGRLLKLDDYDTLTAEDGEQALTIIEQKRPDIVLLDIRMPGKDGLEVLAEAKPKYKNMEFIMISGHGDIDTAVQTLRAGAFGYIQKPIDYDELELEIQKALEKRGMQRKLDEHVAHLEQAIKEKERLNEELIRAKEKAEKANRSKTVFLANMSHDLRTPLTSVMGFLDLLQGTALDNSQGEYAANIRESSQLLLTLINDILEISKIESDKLELNPKPFDMAYLLESMVVMFRPKLAGTSVEIKAVIAQDVPVWMNGDATRIRQILLNLLSNAVKFTRQGEISIRVSLDDEAKSQADGIPVIIQVNDTGIGIAKERIRHVFNYFEQADTTIQDRFGGTGLGLYIVKHLAEKMGGHVSVVSQEGKGSSFKVEILLKETKQPPPGAPAAQPPLIGAVGTPQIIDAVKEACERSQIHIDFTTGSYAELSDWITHASCRAVLLLCDLELGGKDCKRHFQAFKSKHPNLGGVAITGLNHRGSGAEAEKCGFSGYVPKQEIRQELGGIIKLLLHRPQAQLVSRHSVKEHALKGKRVLVTEDGPMIQRFIKIMLSKNGAQPDLANNGREAIGKLKENTYDFCLMDVNMPVMDGLEATRYIRNKLKSGIPIFALTANAFEEDRQKCLAAGMTDFITKPIDEIVLKEMVVKYV